MMLRFKLNGEWIECEAEHNETLLDLLREKLGVKSVKRGCNVGECGACTVLLDGRPVNSCLLLAPLVEGRSVETLEGLRDKPIMKTLIEAFVEDGAIQCGFCTPGMLISAYSLLSRNPKPSEEEVRRAISGNLCRCTGYVNIVKAILDASERLRGED
ncbi:MAG TPA: (2Fe-2S)-binding protein [Candidatus Bathyarchaeota archaeon]|nr:(2Fe-2S)-binding protein [Candidatus Bathyarchaeota archaeon]